ncbi:glutamate 5-kinase [Pelagirhabdus alkalitolerans]|uniref:Glutamate 5-kinase n=1 Tax=Pelagirhabdus alkalitolerans TaxID=1612202 RepID=A0A1G6H744_9BACI|nr:glutamate 5-kinase [Pelagirhabdus alkalitolerans]SDB90031.1 glutamate 5-kinase [Pelagirhabdus alkalitolerans]
MKHKRVVVKIGSSSLTQKDGTLARDKLSYFSEAIVHLMNAGIEVILISSGAVSAGFRDLGYSSRPVTVAGKQAAASVGQGLLIEAYNHQFKQHGYVSSQLLLTRDVFSNEVQFSNVYQTLNELIKRKVIPIINENDSVAIDELTFGDNDMLSALVSGLINADALLLLTDINGIYDKNPNDDSTAKRYDHLDYISNQLIEETSQNSTSKVGTGGMKSKLIAAQMATTLGVNCFIGTANTQNPLIDILHEKGDGTYIGQPENVHVRKHKQWIAFHSNTKGRILVDDGAKQALLSEGKSLLAAGILAVEDEFEADDVIEIYHNRQLIAKGQVNYSSEQLKKVRGLNSQDVMSLTDSTRQEVIHRNKLILTIQED